MPRTSAWPPERRAEALDHYRREGLAAAHKATGLPRSTIATWAREDGATPGEPAGVVAQSAAKRTGPALEARARQLDDARDRRVIALASAAELALGGILNQLREGKADHVPIRDLVGVVTRAHHDLALLTGEATEHLAVQVVFNVPAPSEQPPVVVPQDQLPALGA
jgi:hypothetical protein